MYREHPTCAGGKGPQAAIEAVERRSFAEGEASGLRCRKPPRGSGWPAPRAPCRPLVLASTLVGERLVADPALEPLIAAGGEAPGWCQRRLYLGEAGARRWLAVAASLDHRRPVGRLERQLLGGLRDLSRRTAEATVSAAAVTRFRTLVSLGPGEGQLDLELAEELGRGQAGVRYLPVDLSRELLTLAAERLSQAVDVPVAVLGDFEEGFDFIDRVVRENSEAPRLYSLLGNTLSNLDLGELRFLENLARRLGPGDGLLLSVAVTGAHWKAVDDPLSDLERYLPAMRRFLAADLGHTYVVEGSSDVPGVATAVDLVDEATGRTLFRVRRYRWGPMLDWLRAATGLELAFQRRLTCGRIEAVGVATLLAPAA